jgi:hypothetical protein
MGEAVAAQGLGNLIFGLLSSRIIKSLKTAGETIATA